MATTTTTHLLADYIVGESLGSLEDSAVERDPITIPAAETLAIWAAGDTASQVGDVKGTLGADIQSRSGDDD